MNKPQETGAETPKERKKWLERVPLSFLLIVLLFFLCLGLLLVSADWVYRQRNFLIDRWATDNLHPYITPGWTTFMEFITFFGQREFPRPGHPLSCVWFHLHQEAGQGRHPDSYYLLYQYVHDVFLKDILKRSRPIVPLVSRAHGYSFPSGHSLSSVVFYGMLAYLAAKYIRPAWLRNFTILFLSSWGLAHRRKPGLPECALCQRRAGRLFTRGCLARGIEMDT